MGVHGVISVCALQELPGMFQEYFFDGFARFDSLPPVTRLLCLKADRKGSQDKSESANFG
jgi:hypothetical protein